VRQVPRYTFKLFDDSGGIEDDVGVSLPNPEIATLAMSCWNS
jgi:hypothetical protein